MQTIMVLGAGKIGRLIAFLLAESDSYRVHLADIDIENIDLSCLGPHESSIDTVSIDVNHKEPLAKYLHTHKVDAVISSLPYFCNVAVAELARELNIHYFDLTEDTEVTKKVSELSKDAVSAFVPQCGLAPGFISIAANDLIQHFDTLESVKMRVGALPVNPNNALKYSLTWSTDGLINEYGNLCHALKNHEQVTLQPLEGLETIQIDGLLYEAFNTSGGLGSLANTYQNKVKNMNYKTLRYPGHCKKIRFLMNDLKLNSDRTTLKRILENAIPKTKQDVVLIYVAVKGMQGDELIEETFVKKVYPEKIAGENWSAIQVTTAASACAVMDLVLQNPDQYKGLVLQEQFNLEQVQNNRFGKFYK